MGRARKERDRVVATPPGNDPSVANRIVSLTLRPGERVRWEWSVLPDGRRYVSGYQILLTWRAARREPRGTP